MIAGANVTRVYNYESHVWKKRLNVAAEGATPVIAQAPEPPRE